MDILTDNKREYGVPYIDSERASEFVFVTMETKYNTVFLYVPDTRHV